MTQHRYNRNMDIKWKNILKKIFKDKNIIVSNLDLLHFYFLNNVLYIKPDNIKVFDMIYHNQNDVIDSYYNDTKKRIKIRLVMPQLDNFDAFCNFYIVNSVESAKFVLDRIGDKEIKAPIPFIIKLFDTFFKDDMLYKFKDKRLLLKCVYLNKEQCSDIEHCFDIIRDSNYYEVLIDELSEFILHEINSFDHCNDSIMNLMDSISIEICFSKFKDYYKRGHINSAYLLMRLFALYDNIDSGYYYEKEYWALQYLNSSFSNHSFIIEEDAFSSLVKCYYDGKSSGKNYEEAYYWALVGYSYTLRHINEICGDYINKLEEILPIDLMITTQKRASALIKSWNSVHKKEIKEYNNLKASNIQLEFKINRIPHCNIELISSISIIDETGNRIFTDNNPIFSKTALRIPINLAEAVKSHCKGDKIYLQSVEKAKGKKNEYFFKFKKDQCRQIKKGINKAIKDLLEREDDFLIQPNLEKQEYEINTDVFKVTLS